ncbi:MAG: hypothetical protein RL219_273 [Actinomycetota bacterium]|jgi:hypothetical protein
MCSPGPRSDDASVASGSVLLAELEVWHSRPIAPTRRVSLGHLVLPADPAPGVGGLLLGAVVAAHAPEIDEELAPDIHRLLNEVERGDRVVQPRLRHRFQVDRHGLARSLHSVHSEGEQLTFEFRSQGTPLQQVLGAVYALERLEHGARRVVAPALRRAYRWRGPLGQAFIEALVGGASSSLSAVTNPTAWALDLLGFPPGTVRPSKKDVAARFRSRVRDAHPDAGGNADVAARLIADLGEARRILSA